MKLSLLNLVAAASVIGSTAAAAFPAANVKSPERPFQPWRSTGLGVQSLVVDFGAAVVLNVVAPIHANVGTVTIQGNATDVWTSPAYSQTQAIGRNPWNTRYQAAHLPVGFTYRYLRLLIDSQTPLDGLAYYSLGGLWAGGLESPARAVRYDYDIEPIEPRKDVQPEHGGWRERLTMGYPLSQIMTRRQALLAADTVAGLADQLAAWLDLDRRMFAGDYFLLLLDRDVSRHVWVARRLNTPRWRIAWPLAESDLEFEEVVGP